MGDEAKARAGESPTVQVSPVDVDALARGVDPALAASIGRPRRRRGRAVRTRCATADGIARGAQARRRRRARRRARRDDLRATARARLSRRRRSLATGRVGARRLRAPELTAGRAAATADDRAASPSVLALVDAAARHRAAGPRCRGSTTWSRASSKAASATASTSRCAAHSDETRALLDRLLRIADAVARHRRAAPTTSCTTTSRHTTCCRRRRAHHRRRRLGGRDERRRGLRSRHARVLHLRLRRARRVARRPRPIAPTRARSRSTPRTWCCARSTGRCATTDDVTIQWCLDLGTALLDAVGAG